MPIASRIPGIESRTSVVRMRIASILPPRPPASAPMIIPITSAMITALTPTCRLICAPYRIRLNWSRPWRSVPMTCADDGGWRRFESSPSSGPYGAMIGASRAAPMNTTMHTTPSIAGLLRMSRRNAADHRPRLARRSASGVTVVAVAVMGSSLRSRVPYPRVEVGVADVDQEVHHQEHEGEDEDRRLDDEVVTVADRLHHVPPHAVPAEHGLGQHGAGEQPADLEADDRDHRQPRVAHDVPCVDPALLEALRASRPDVVLVVHVE